MAGFRPLIFVITGVMVTAAGCFPEPFGHTNVNDPDYEGSPAPTATAPGLVDEDGDGDPAETDCDDTDATVNHSATEVAYDGLDNDCVDGDLTDVDGDGYDASQVAGPDCDDNEAAINPGATDICNDIDDDCSGVADDDTSQHSTYWLDDDSDSYGDPSDTVSGCAAPDGYVVPGDEDCDDTDDAINPGASEVCDLADQDCDDDIDEGTQSTFTLDDDGDGYGANGGAQVEACTVPEGYSATDDDCDDADDTISPSAAETCDEVDEDCDDTVDEGVQNTYYTDDDDDSYGVGEVLACSLPDGAAEAGGDCDDTNAAINPSAAEICDELDQDCDGATDEGALTSFFVDADQDTYGDANNITEACEDPGGTSSNGDDCDDTNADIYPGALERCSDGIDSDCDQAVDPSDASLCSDDDGDGYIEAPPEGVAADCDDTNADVSPIATEIADEIDNDCDGLIDEGTAAFDDDGDGVTEDEGDCDDADPDRFPGNPEQCDDIDHDCNGDSSPGDGDEDGTDDCVDDDEDGFSEIEGDCDDQEQVVNPDASETANGIDDNCDDLVDNRMNISAEVEGGRVSLAQLPGYTRLGSALYLRSGGRSGQDVLIRARASANSDTGSEAMEALLTVNFADGREDGVEAFTISYVGPDGSGFGDSAAFGDVDGDGLVDTVIGASNLGQVCIYLGQNASTNGAALAMDDADSCFLADSLADGVGAPGRLAVLDLDDDSFDDIVIGAPFAGTPVDGASAAPGEVYIIAGMELDEDQEWPTVLSPEDSAAILDGGGSTGLGRLLSGPHEMDTGEGLALLYDVPGGSPEIWMIYAESELFDLVAKGTEVVPASDYSSVIRPGGEITSMPLLGDLNSDELDELLLAGPLASEGQGGLALLSGANEQLAPGGSVSLSSANVILTDAVLGGQLGASVDLMASGGSGSSARMVVSDPGMETEGDLANAGAVFLVEGSPSIPRGSVDEVAQAWWIGANADDGLGTVVLFFDVDSDGVEELLMTAPGFDGGAGALYTLLEHIPFGAADEQ